MRFLIVGYGRVGRAVALNLKVRGHHVEAVDVKKCYDKLLDGFHVIDVSKEVFRVSKLVEEFDCTCSCLPGRLGYKFMESCVERGVKLVDVSFMSEDPTELDLKARRAGSTIIPDCGIAPGLSNMIVGLSVKAFEHVDSVEIRVGGLPLAPKPPLYHSPSWSIEDLLEEYTRPARYVENGTVKMCDPLSFRTVVKIKNWEFEAFLSDGLRTLLRMKRRPNFLRELTLRWRGHLNVIKLLRDLNFISDEEVEVQGVRMPIKTLTAKILERSMTEEPDIVLMEVEIQGTNDEDRVHEVLRVYGSAFNNSLSTMAKVTGAVCSEVAVLLAEDRIECKGVVPPEDLNDLRYVVRRVLKNLEGLGMHVEFEGLELSKLLSLS